jgi:hypothetical protein
VPDRIASQAAVQLFLWESAFSFNQNTIGNKGPRLSCRTAQDEASQQEGPEESEPGATIGHGTEPLSGVFDPTEDCRTHRRQLASFELELRPCHRCEPEVSSLLSIETAALSQLWKQAEAVYWTKRRDKF